MVSTKNWHVYVQKSKWRSHLNVQQISCTCRDFDVDDMHMITRHRAGWIWMLRPIGQKFGECCAMLKKASTWPSGVSMFVFRPRLFWWVVWQYHRLTITSTSAFILTKASRGQITSTNFFHRVLGESTCYDACEGYYRTLLFEEYTLVLFDLSSNTRVLSGVEVRSQSWWSCKNRSVAAIMLRFRLWQNDLTTIHSSYFTRLSQIWPPPIWLSCCHHHRTTLDIPLENNRTLSLLLKNIPPSLVFCHARLFFGIAYHQNCRRAHLSYLILAHLSSL